MDARLDQNEAELAVDILTVAFQMLADADGALDQVVEVLGNVWLQANRLHDAQHFVSVDETDLGNSVRVTEYDS